MDSSSCNLCWMKDFSSCKERVTAVTSFSSIKLLMAKFSGLVILASACADNQIKLHKSVMWINQVKNRNTIFACQQIRKVEVVILTWIEVSAGQFTVKKWPLMMADAEVIISLVSRWQYLFIDKMTGCNGCNLPFRWEVTCTRNRHVADIRSNWMLSFNALACYKYALTAISVFHSIHFALYVRMSCERTTYSLCAFCQIPSICLMSWSLRFGMWARWSAGGGAIDEGWLWRGEN